MKMSFRLSRSSASCWAPCPPALSPWGVGPSGTHQSQTGKIQIRSPQEGGLSSLCCFQKFLQMMKSVGSKGHGWGTWAGLVVFPMRPAPRLGVLSLEPYPLAPFRHGGSKSPATPQPGPNTDGLLGAGAIGADAARVPPEAIVPVAVPRPHPRAAPWWP